MWAKQAFFQNAMLTQDVAVTLTFFSTIGQGSSMDIINVPAGSTTGPTVFTIYPQQTITVVFQVGKNGGYLTNDWTYDTNLAVPVTWQVEDIDWG